MSVSHSGSKPVTLCAVHAEAITLSYHDKNESLLSPNESIKLEKPPYHLTKSKRENKISYT